MTSHRKSGSRDAPQEDTHDRAATAAAGSAEFCDMPELFLSGQSGASLADRGQHAAEHGESSGAQLYGMPQSLPIQGPSSSSGMPASLSFQMESSKKPRTQFTPKQLCHLEEIFEKNRFPNAKERGAIAKELNLTLNHIQIWFQNRRAKFRRKKKKHKVEEELSKVPRPPSFWPANLPFDSNIAQTQLQEAEVSKKKGSSSQDSSDSPEVPVTSIFTPLASASASSSLPGSSKKVSRTAKTPSSMDTIPPSRSVEHPATLPMEGPHTREMSQLQSFLESPSSIMSPPIFAESPVLLYDILEDIPDLLMSPLHEGYMPGMEISPQVFPGPGMQRQTHQHSRPPVPSYPQHHFTPPPQYYNPAYDISYLPSSSFLPQTTISQQPPPPRQPPPFSTPSFSSGDRFSPRMPLSSTPSYHLPPLYRDVASSQTIRQYQPQTSSHVQTTSSSHLPKTTRPHGL